VIVASKRAKELLKGAKARIKTKSRNPIRIAQNEVKLGLIKYEILKSKKEEAVEPEDHVFLGEDVVGELGEVVAGEEAALSEDEVEPEFSDEFEPPEELEEEEKEEEEEG